MKRLVAFLFLCAGLWGLGQNHDFDLLSLNSIESVTYVSAFGSTGAECIQNGNDYYYNYDIQKAKALSENFKNAKAVVLNIKNDTLSNIKKFYKIDIYSSYEVENVMVYEGCTNLYDDYKMVENKKVNVQIAVKDKLIIVGFPMILTGF